MSVAQQTHYQVDHRKHLLRSVLYFDIFNYPLTAKEIASFSNLPTNISIQALLDELVTSRTLFQLGEFYSIQNNPALNERRVKGNALAKQKMEQAKKYSGIISAFPFVRAVMLSGSISKNYMDEKSDIDYFIITAPKRLWVVRTAMAFFRRVFLLNSHKNFCTNYFLDTENLTIPDQNIFTTVELLTLKPMYGTQCIESFHRANPWTNEFLPNVKPDTAAVLTDGSVLKNIFEKILSLNIFDSLDRWLLRITIRRWKAKHGSALSEEDFKVAFRSTNGISRSHPQFFQKRVMDRFDQKIQSFEVRHGIDLSL
ncbi:hypothetical protein WSM22_18780 [Cytophagales bacterium WSM2-2]|nr:hypothetical protein WSM22_18780 [Cytophagales bacterium WSM2-2]